MESCSWWGFRRAAGLICVLGFGWGVLPAEPAIHVFAVFCNAYPGSAGEINESVNSDRYVVLDTFENHVSEHGWGVRLNLQVVEGEEATKAGIERRWNQLRAQVQPDDTVFVHFSGHGEIPDPTSGVQYLQTCDLQSMNRETWARSISTAPCRLKVLVTDCCSSYPPSELAEGTEDVEPWKTLYFLLIRHEGFVNITAASPGQFAYGTLRGGYLTVNLHSDMQRFQTWKAVFQATEARVVEETVELIRGIGDPELKPQRPFAYELGRSLSGAGEVLPESVSYVIPDSNRRSLGRRELESMSLQQLYLARNEIFARHGYDFGTPLLQTYFGSRSWYRKKPGFKNPNLSRVESGNVNLILAVEKENGGPFVASAKSLPGDSSRAAVPDIFPYSSEQALPRTVVQGLSRQELSLARNEIYARHGYSFRNATLRDYFSRKPYYRRDPSGGEPSFNAVERQNLWLIRKIERLRGGAYSW